MGLEIAGTLTKEKNQGAFIYWMKWACSAFKDYYPAQLSGGMRQRVALVRTLATEPELLLLDEPFSALDYQTKLQLEDLVVETLRAKKKTAILVTHDISEAIAMSDRIIVLAPNPGRIRKNFLKFRRWFGLQCLSKRENCLNFITYFERFGRSLGVCIMDES